MRFFIRKQIGVTLVFALAVALVASACGAAGNTGAAGSQGPAGAAGMDHKVLKDPKAQLAQPDPLAKRELQAWTNHWDSVTRTEMVLQ